MKDSNYYKGRVRTYWETVGTVATRNIKLRYKNSFLGFFWSLLNPLMYLTIFIVVFSRVFPSIENYPLFAITGLLFWNFFSTSSAQIINTIYEHAGILKSINVPPIVFPLSALVANLFNFVLSLIPFLILMFWFGLKLDLLLLTLIPFLILYSVFVFAISFMLACLNVYFRDISMFWNTVLPALFYATPVVYPVEQLPQSIRWLMLLNPF